MSISTNVLTDDQLGSTVLRAFRAGDGAALAAAWTQAAPSDPISEHRFRSLFLLDRNFDPAGLLVAEEGGAIVGACYAVRRRIAHDGDDLEPDQGWIPFFFVVPGHTGRRLGRTLLVRSLAWLAGLGISRVTFSAYTPNYFLPGLDTQRYPAADHLLRSLGFDTVYDCVAMDRSLVGYAVPAAIQERITALQAAGYWLGSPSGDDLVDLIAIAGTQFNSDWSRAIREGVVNGLPLERILAARSPEGVMLGWAMCGTYEHVLDRFGPFGVVPASRGTGLGEALLHLTLQRMVALGAHSAWFLWTEPDSPAGHLYAKTGFVITRTFTVLRAAIS